MQTQSWFLLEFGLFLCSWLLPSFLHSHTLQDCNSAAASTTVKQVFLHCATTWSLCVSSCADCRWVFCPAGVAAASNMLINDVCIVSVTVYQPGSDQIRACLLFIFTSSLQMKDLFVYFIETICKGPCTEWNINVTSWCAVAELAYSSFSSAVPQQVIIKTYEQKQNSTKQKNIIQRQRQQHITQDLHKQHEQLKMLI